MLFAPFMFYPLPELESKMFNLKSQTNGNKSLLYEWNKYKPKHMPFILKSKYNIRIDIKDEKTDEKEVYVGILEPFGKIFYSVEEQEKESILVFTIYGIVVIKDNNINTKFLSPAAELFLLKKSFIDLINKILEKGDALLTLSKFLLSLYEHINSLNYEQFIDFCNANDLKKLAINKDDFDILVPVNFINENNYKEFDSTLYLSLLFWLFSIGDTEIKIIE